MSFKTDQKDLAELNDACVGIGSALLDLVECLLWARKLQKKVRANIRTHLRGDCDCNPPSNDCYKQAHKVIVP